VRPNTNPPRRTDSDLIEGRDYVVDARGAWVFTAAYLARRGHCCGSGCRHCPYAPRHTAGNTTLATPADPRG
jgi:hypothetical protein